MLIVPLCIIYSWNHSPEPSNPKAFLILILILETGMIGTFCAQDLILFFVFFEVVLLPMYFMIGVWGGEKRALRGDEVLPLHAVRLGAHDRQLHGAVLPLGQGAGPRWRLRHTFDMRVRSMAAAGISTTAALWIFGGMFMGFGIKVPMFPFHTWLPDAHTQAPTGRLGDPGRRAAEARHLRLHPHRPADPARRRPRSGHRSSACWR